MTTSIITAADEMALRECLAPVVAERCGGESAIASIRWKRFDLATSYAARVVTVHFHDGGSLELFLKDFGFSVRAKDDPRERREREVRVYRELLPRTTLGTAAYHGSVLDEAHGRLWLLLELVDGTPVGYCDIVPYWGPATAALGRLHGAFASRADALARCEFLVHHTTDFFWSTLERAADCVSRIAPGLSGELSGIARRYPPIVEVMTDQPRTLLHGGCRTTNILVKIAGDPARVCIVDWEEAACGAPLYDLAYLLDGIEPPTLDPLLDAYRGEARAHDLPLPPRRDVKHVIDCFRLHTILATLAKAVIKGYREGDVAKLLGIAGRLADAVCGRAGRRAPRQAAGTREGSPAR
ncbi:MAG TPA: phosphotransferase [Gemmatimonadaceae bacterium]